MGTDCTLVIEIRRVDGGRWEMMCVIPLDRNYALFDMLKEHGIPGYPAGVSYLTWSILNEEEDWGEGHMSLEQFYKLAKKFDIPDFVRKKLRDKCRVVFRFDN